MSDIIKGFESMTKLGDMCLVRETERLTQTPVADRSVCEVEREAWFHKAAMGSKFLQSDGIPANFTLDYECFDRLCTERSMQVYGDMKKNFAEHKAQYKDHMRKAGTNGAQLIATADLMQKETRRMESCKNYDEKQMRKMKNCKTVLEAHAEDFNAEIDLAKQHFKLAKRARHTATNVFMARKEHLSKRLAEARESLPKGALQNTDPKIRHYIQRLNDNSDKRDTIIAQMHIEEPKDIASTLAIMNPLVQKFLIDSQEAKAMVESANDRYGKVMQGLGSIYHDIGEMLPKPRDPNHVLYARTGGKKGYPDWMMDERIPPKRRRDEDSEWIKDETNAKTSRRGDWAGPPREYTRKENQAWWKDQLSKKDPQDFFISSICMPVGVARRAVFDGACASCMSVLPHEREDECKEDPSFPNGRKFCKFYFGAYRSTCTRGKSCKYLHDNGLFLQFVDPAIKDQMNDHNRKKRRQW